MLATKAFFFLVTIAVSVNANCVHNTRLSRRQEGVVEVSKFGYTGLQGPLNWAGLDPANSACANAKVQSPINIDNTIQKATEAPKVVIEDVEEAEFENLGTTLETIVSGTTTFGGKEFKLLQFHVHSPSEHRIAEEHFPLEVHMVHEASDGALAVIALPFQLTEDGSTTELLTAVIQNIDQVATPGTATKTGPLKFQEVINAIQTKPLFQYTGSLTTPPCAEGLTFLVLEEPLPLNVKTYNALKKVIKFNSRYTQNTPGENNLLRVAADLAAQQSGCQIKDGASPISVEPIDNGGAKETSTTESAPAPTSPSNEGQHEKIVQCLNQCSPMKRGLHANVKH